MAFHTLNKTLTGGNDPITTIHTPVKQVIIFNITGNSTLLVGDKNISATVCGFVLLAGTFSPSIGPFAGELPFNLDEIYLRGAQNDVVRVTYLT